jgi:uncharacterized membrane protein YbaN (DUF454 family)
LVPIKRALRIASGLAMVVAGLAGLALPILPGWILLIPGLILLSREFHWARRLLGWLRSWLPHDVAKHTQIPSPPDSSDGGLGGGTGNLP